MQIPSSLTSTLHDGFDTATAYTRRGIDTASAYTREGLHSASVYTRRVARGTLAGLIAGTIAAYVVNKYEFVQARPQRRSTGEPTGAATAETQADAPVRAAVTGASTAVAERVSRRVFQHELTDSEKQLAGPALHYSTAALAGAGYGFLSEVIPAAGTGLGIPYAAIFWLAGDQLTFPALGLVPHPSTTSGEIKASSFARRLAFGITLDISRRILRRIL